MNKIPENTELILFDLGGVVINIEWQRSVHEFARLTKSTFEELNQLMRENELVQKIETGAMQPEKFRNWFRDLFEIDLADSEIDLAWNAMLRDIPHERVNIIRKLSKEYSVMCLSNTNAIHIKAFNQILKNENGVENLESIMHKTYYSHLLKTRKPDPRAWEIILQENHLKPKSVLYFDDNENNHKIALELGINSVLISNDYTIEMFFNE